MSLKSKTNKNYKVLLLEWTLNNHSINKNKYPKMTSQSALMMMSLQRKRLNLDI